jgi:hypothetical protein
MSARVQDLHRYANFSTCTSHTLIILCPHLLVFYSESQRYTDDKVHSNVHFFTSLLSPSTTVTHSIHPHTSSSGSRKDKLFYAQLIQTSGFNTGASVRDGSKARVSISALGKEVTLGEGDGVFVQGLREGDEVKVGNTGEKRGEVMLFEMDA